MKCRICGNGEGNQTYEVPEKMFGLYDVFTYLECAKCGCLQIKEIPQDMGKYYPKDYYSFSRQAFECFNGSFKSFMKRLRDSYTLSGKGIVGRMLFHRFPEGYTPALQSLSKMDMTEDMRILDAGCGVGVLLYALKNIGFNNLLGIDGYIGGDICYQNGLMIRRQMLYDTKGEWDRIMFHHSFEHLPDPLESLQHCAKLLARGGMCLVRIPTVSSYAWKYYRANWVQLDAPRHFYLHSVESLTMLASMAGFEVVDVVYDSTEFQFWGSEQYMKDISLVADKSYAKDPSGSIFSPEEVELFKERSKALNLEGQGDQAAFYLRKIRDTSQFQNKTGKCP